ncbi:hypothetical protein N7501_002719 [Penicillium viridicatum]|nr:hypothetical protein N7501_002719 [Penicillium viridicatum]
MISCDSDPIRKDWVLLPSHRPLTSLPPPPGIKEDTPTDPKDREALLTPTPAQHVRSQPQNSRIGHWKKEIENSPTPHYTRLLSVEIKDEEALSTEITPHATTKFESGELKEEDIQPTPPSPPYSIIPSIEIEDEDILSTILMTKHGAFQHYHSRCTQGTPRSVRPIPKPVG